MSEVKIPIYVLDKEAKQFILFQKNYDLFNLLLSSKVFEQKNCTILLDFDKFGTLKAIRRNDYLYSDRNK